MNIFLLADFEDILRVIVPLLFLLFWVLGQLGDAKKASGPKKMVRPRRQGGDGLPPPNQADPLRERVAEILQEGGHARDAQGREVELRDHQLEQHRRIAAQRPKMQPGIELLAEDDPTAVEAIPVQLAPELAKRRPLTQRRRPAAGPRAIGEHASQLGEQVAMADDKLESRLHAKFDHDVGRLSDTHRSKEYQRTDSRSVVADQIAELLANPQHIRQAMILNEIINRPPDRW